MSYKNIITTEVLIPAYSSKQDAFLIPLTLQAIPHEYLLIQTDGNIACALKYALHRTVEIMASIKPVWQPLQAHHYTLQGQDPRFVVKDARSAGLALAIALLNIHRTQNQKSQIYSLIGTGLLRIDGSFEATHKEDIKKTAISKAQLITSSTCRHVFELEHFMEKR